MVLWWRKNTGRVFCEGAWRAVCVIKVYDDFSVFHWLSVIISAGWIRLFAAGEILEFDKQLAAFGFGRIELIFYALKLESDISVQSIFGRFAKAIGLVRLFRDRITRIVPIHAEAFINGEPSQQWKRKTLPSLIIPNADGVFAGVFVQDQAYFVPRDKAGLGVLTGPESCFLHQSAIDLRPYSLRDLQAGSLAP